MKKYIIDYMYGSGSGCDTIFDTIEDARRHMNLSYTDTEREGLEIVPVEVGYLVYISGGRLEHQYVWRPEDIENGGLCDCPNGYDDLFGTKAEAEHLKEEVENYIEAHEYTLTVGIEEVVKS